MAQITMKSRMGSARALSTDKRDVVVCITSLCQGIRMTLQDYVEIHFVIPVTAAQPMG